jgi:hypothetical protein
VLVIRTADHSEQEWRKPRVGRTVVARVDPRVGPDRLPRE